MNFVEPSESSWQEFTIEGGANGWYRGEVCNRFPEDRAHEGEYDLDQVIKCVVGGWAPKSPFLTRKDMVTALGSCFAYEVERNLRQAGYRTSLASYGEYTEDSKAKIWEHSLLIKCSEGHVNTASIRTQFEWVYDESLAPLKIWKKVDGVIKEYLDNNREVAKLIFSETTCFIITLGLSEVWYNKVTQEVLWTSVPKAQFDKDIYGFRLLTVQENLENLKRTVAIIRQHKGNIPIVFTLSPIPLAATFRPIPAISATSVSKALLRVAVDELIRTSDDPNLYYFPSYEIITGYLKNPMGSDHLHPTSDAVQLIMDTFLKLYAKEEPMAAEGPQRVAHPWARVDTSQANRVVQGGQKARACPECGSACTRELFSLEEFQYFSDSAGRAKRLPLSMRICADCGQVHANPCPTTQLWPSLISEGRLPGPEDHAADAFDWLSHAGLLPPDGGTVLDLGCARGAFLSRLGEKLIKVGMDPDPGLIEAAREACPGPSFRFFSSDWEDLPAMAPPDLITISKALAFVPDPGALLTRLRELAGPETRLFISVPVPTRQPHDVFGFFSPVMANHLTMAAIGRILSRTGWRILQTDHCRIHAMPEAVTAKGRPGRDRRAVHSNAAFHHHHLAVIETIIERIGQAPRLIIWGAGLHTELLYHLTSLFAESPQREYLIVDSNPSLQGRTWRGIRILPPSVLKDCVLRNLPILISTAQRNGLHSIRAQARILGVPPENMITLFRPGEPDEELPR